MQAQVSRPGHPSGPLSTSTALSTVPLQEKPSKLSAKRIVTTSRTKKSHSLGYQTVRWQRLYEIVQCWRNERVLDIGKVQGCDSMKIDQKHSSEQSHKEHQVYSSKRNNREWKKLRIQVYST